MARAVAINLPRLILISYAYPPLKWPRAIQVYRLVCGLADIGYEMVLLKASPRTAFGGVDTSLKSLVVPKNLQAIDVNAFYKNMLLKIAYKVIPILKKCPDAFNGWIIPALITATKLIKKNSSNYIICTFSNPWSDHIIGLMLVKIFKAKWVTHFSDPWALNPYLKTGYIERRLLLFVESKVLSASSRIVFVSEETLEIYVSHYGEWLRKKSHVLPHITCSYPHNSLTSENNYGYISFLYAGDFYGPRTPLPLIMALQMIDKESPELLKKLRFKFLGNTPREYIQLIKKTKLECIEICKSVPYLSSLKEMSEADVLLLIDAPSKESSVFFPSKLVDYIAFGKPIFAITPKKGTSARIVLELGGVVADPASVLEIKECIVSLVNNVGSYEQFSPSTSNRSRYSQNIVAEKFSRILEGI